MDLRQPHRIETPALGGIDLLERGGERFLVADPGRPLKLVKHAELERHRLPPFPTPAQPSGRRFDAHYRSRNAKACANPVGPELREDWAARRVLERRRRRPLWPAISWRRPR